MFTENEQTTANPRYLELSFDRLVVGSDLSAFAYCFLHKCPAIYLRVLRPYKYDQYGTYEKDIQLWNDLAFSLTMKSLLPFGDLIVSLRLEEGNLKAVTKLGTLVNIKFNLLVVSDDYNLEGLPPPTGKTSTLNWIIDWFNVRHGMIHQFDTIEDPEDDFAKKIYFYISKRFYKNATRKDCVVVSRLTDEELASDEYGENIVRLKAAKMMVNAGIKGVWDKTNNRFLPPKLTSVMREIHPHGKNKYSNLPNDVHMLYDSAEDILRYNDSSYNTWYEYYKQYGTG